MAGNALSGVPIAPDVPALAATLTDDPADLAAPLRAPVATRRLWRGVRPPLREPPPASHSVVTVALSPGSTLVPIPPRCVIIRGCSRVSIRSVIMTDTLSHLDSDRTSLTKRTRYVGLYGMRGTGCLVIVM